MVATRRGPIRFPTSCRLGAGGSGLGPACDDGVVTAGSAPDGGGPQPGTSPYAGASAPPDPPPYPGMVPGGAAAVPLPAWYAGLRPAAGELATVVRLGGLLMLTGLPLGVLWWFRAPRRAYLVAEEGAFAIVPESEAAVGSDGWFLLLTGVVAALAALVSWRFLRHRGPLVTAALAAGMLLCGLATWFVGSLLGAGPSAAELTAVGDIVLGPLELRAHGVLVVGPFLAVAGYLLGACFTARDDLSRSGASVGRTGDAELDQGHGDGL